LRAVELALVRIMATAAITSSTAASRRTWRHRGESRRPSGKSRKPRIATRATPIIHDGAAKASTGGAPSSRRSTANHAHSIALGYPDAASLHVACGDLETPAGDYGAALNNLSRAVSAAGDTLRALERATSALELCAKLGDRHREAAIRNTLADLLHAAGRENESMEELKRSVALFAEIGEPGELEPEIWKLSEW
jgi:hypothetical protein